MMLGVEYDARRFQWLASLVNGPSACAVRTDAGINSIEEVIAGKQWILATEGPGTTTYDVPVILQEALGANIKMVPGYTGTSRMRLAIESREVEGGCWTWDSMRQAFARVVADEEFLAEVGKAQLDVDPLPAQEVEARVKLILDTPPAVVANLKEVLR